VVVIATENQDSRMPVSNVCPHCGTLVPMKQEHLGMRTRKLNCPGCKKPFRPGGPWPTDDPDLPTAKQASDRFEIGRNFAHKLWNAARFLLLNLEGYTRGPVNAAELPLEDRWILSRLATTTEAVTEQLEGYHFADVARALYEFTWSEFCDWYLEMSKDRLKGPDRATAQRVLVGVLDGILRLVHPVMPFVAESLWQALNEAAPERGLPSPAKAAESVVIAPWPSYPAAWKDAAMETRLARMQELVRAVREIRNHYQIDSRTPLDVAVRCAESVADDFRQLTPFIRSLAGVGKLELGPGVRRVPPSASSVQSEFDAYVPLKGLIDEAAEAQRVEKQIADIQKRLPAAKAKLGNESFVKNAPAEVVQQQRELIAELEKQLRLLQEILDELRPR
jgi:valyl-tRNA synthetase